MKFLAILIVTLVLAVSAQADILIFKTTTTGHQLDFASKVIEKKGDRGYLVLNTDLSNPDSVTISDASYLHYEKKGTSKTQVTQVFTPAAVEMILVNFGKANKKMILRWFDEPTGSYSVAYGIATSKDIGGVSRFVATSVIGDSVWRLVEFRTGSGSVRLVLDLSATRAANAQGKSVTDIISDYEAALAVQGYNAE